MITVSCPKCSDQVTVPASAPRSARVRCPLCQEEYDLADALAQLPPALIVISPSLVDEPVLAAVGGMDSPTGSQIGSAIDHGFDSHLEGGSGKGYSSHVLEAGTAQLDAGPSHEEKVSAPTPAFRSSPRPKRKEKSMVGEVVKIVLGGVVGIGLAIVILWWVAGVDLGLAPTVAKVSWLRWVLPQKILDKVEKNEGIKEENPTDLQPLETDKGNRNDPAGSTPNKSGKLGSDPRFNEALKTSEEPKASSKFDKPQTTKSGAKSEDKDPFDVSDPFAPETKASGSLDDLKIENPLSSASKPSTKPSAPAKSELTLPTEKPGSEDPFKLPEEKPTPVKPAEPAEEKPKEKKPAVDKPAKENPKEEKPAEKPTEPAETPPQQTPVAAGKLAEGIDAANIAAKAFDDTDAADKDARKTAVVALYNAYAGLGHTVEQTNLEDADNAEKLPALRQTLVQAANEPVKLNSIGALAARKLDAADGDPGILLAGTVKDFRAAGSQFETTLELVRDKRLVTVVSVKNPQDSYKVDDQVLILGSIVRDPKEKLAGYKGEAAIVVKCGHAMVLPAEKKAE